MNEEQIARYAALIFRVTFMLKLIDSDINWMAQFKAPSGIKNELNRLKTVYAKGLDNLTAYMPNDKQTFLNELAANEERISAIGTIFEKLSLMPIDALLETEENFNKAVKIHYGKIDAA